MAVAIMYLRLIGWTARAAEHWVDECAHEFDGDFMTMDDDGQGAGGPRKGRLRKQSNRPTLFSGYSFYLHGAFAKPT